MLSTGAAQVVKGVATGTAVDIAVVPMKSHTTPCRTVEITGSCKPMLSISYMHLVLNRCLKPRAKTINEKAKERICTLWLVKEWWVGQHRVAE